jgi:hypothetical protein
VATAEWEIEPDPVETDEGALDWLVEFVNADLERRRGKGTFDPLRFSAMLFSGDRLGQHEIETTDHDDPWDGEEGELGRRRIRGRILSVEALRRLQLEVREGLEQLSNGSIWKLPGVPRTWHLEPRGVQGPRLGYTGTAETTFLARVAELVTTRWGELRQCSRSDCRAWFRRRRRQEYCSPRCSGLVRQERFRGHTPKRLRNYPAEYQRRLRRKLGANVVAGRRPRS